VYLPALPFTLVWFLGRTDKALHLVALAGLANFCLFAYHYLFLASERFILRDLTVNAGATLIFVNAVSARVFHFPFSCYFVCF
jgi:hypothetical protein